MSGPVRRHRALSHRQLLGAGVAGVAATFAIAPMVAAGASAATGQANAGSAQDQQPDGAVGPTPAATQTIAPNYGSQKIRVGVQVKSGAYVPAGTTTANTETTITETGPNAPDPGSSTCNTDGTTQEAGSTATYCTFAIAQAPERAAKVGDDSIPLGQLYTAQPGDTVSITQTTVNANLLRDTSTKTFGPCLLTPDDENGFCSDEPTALFNDPGIPPTAHNDSGSLKTGGSIVINVTANDTSHGAPSTIQIDTPPADGTATPIESQSAATAHLRDGAAVAASSIRYTPKAGFAGHDKFTYTLRDANGSATATVFLTVNGPKRLKHPAAVNDSASTASGTPVTIAVQRNDDPNGRGALHLVSVGKPSHGTATISGNSIIYRPASGFSGVDHFTYVTRNAGGRASARVTVTVAPAQILPNTGASITSLAVEALALITGGGLLAAAGRRQRRGRGAHS